MKQDKDLEVKSNHIDDLFGKQNIGFKFKKSMLENMIAAAVMMTC